MDRRTFTKGAALSTVGVLGASSFGTGSASPDPNSGGLAEFEFPASVNSGGNQIREVGQSGAVSYHNFHGYTIAESGGGNTTAIVGDTGKRVNLYTGGRMFRSETVRAAAAWQYFDIANDVDEVEISLDFDLKVEASGRSINPFEEETRDDAATEPVAKTSGTSTRTYVDGDEFEPQAPPVVVAIGAGAGVSGLLVALSGSGASYDLGYAIDRVEESETDPTSRIVDSGSFVNFEDSGNFSHDRDQSFSEQITLQNVDPDHTHRFILTSGCAIGALGLAQASVDMEHDVGQWGINYENITIQGA
ncbi:hypothetical protein [Halovivax gelatinilyticus]|uniref:hypothetical protein n=1 Tax=Halovivax gelatinilyticus TaxID=2961597 RepID=UPI0020CA98E8|nr:hypothetical protein [Halovivax gelatinilyticus]